ncbi:MAG TPA: hypothetical protein VF290_26145 [Pyrinomonadaceae bacterium]
MAEDRIKILEERLTRLEATLTQRAAGGGAGSGGFTGGGTVSDPPPWAAGGWTFIPRPSPVVDPAPWPYYGGWGRPPRWPWPNPIADPGPFPTPVVDPAPWPNPIADPAVFAQSLAGRIGKVADPAPPDIGRLSVVQLESALHSIAAERARLDSMEQMVKKQLEAARKQQPG